MQLKDSQQLHMQGSGSMEEKHERASVILRDAFMKNGGFFIKTGQLIASLDVIVPAIYRKNFEMMCHDCKESSYEDVKYTIEHQLKMPIEKIFSQFEQKPVKSASIGQVHKAILKENNQPVAVKVMHKWLLEQSPGDVKLIKKFIDIGEYFFPEFQFQWFGEEVEKNLYQELDFQREVQNGEKARQNLKGVKGITIPKNFTQYCSRSIIVMEWLNGIPIMDIQQLKSSGLDLKKISTEISTAFNKMIHIDGFCHADPHQGNFLVRFNEKNETEVIILDHGLYVTLSEKTKVDYSRLWQGILTQDPILMKKAATDLGVQEDQFQLLVSMVTSRKYSDVIDKELDMKKRLDSPSDVEHRQELSKFGVLYSQQICDILNKLNREMLLLFKTKEFLRTIDNKLGLPINSFQITVILTYIQFLQN
ncbi:Protein kinase-like domain [Pseudocohnilembus persalinus]|uniref:Protein kinase-like domain n=1 Tax=Pseudocohnilembus persalinus TaxID=266149 RepID=A0A0V0Q7T9_PSEPJ|nr:Protein kinase-like domain [Pseudocohnilembus persalinus]|eukprot:KRW98262.1 Protein kinase-like domain [Pseudocohnilembus persalinus]